MMNLHHYEICLSAPLSCRYTPFINGRHKLLLGCENDVEYAKQWALEIFPDATVTDVWETSILGERKRLLFSVDGLTTYFLYYGRRLLTAVRQKVNATITEIVNQAIAEHNTCPTIQPETGVAPFEHEAMLRSGYIFVEPLDKTDSYVANLFGSTRWY